MNVPVKVERQNGLFRATLLGTHDVQAEGAAAEQAVTAIGEQLRNQIATGELVFINVGLVGISGVVGKYKNDPALREICKEAYRQRDAEKDEMFGKENSAQIKEKKIRKG